VETLSASEMNPQQLKNFNQALDIEAQGIAQDLFTIPFMFGRLLLADGEQALRAIAAIRRLLSEMSHAKFVRFVCMTHPITGEFIGYAMTFEPGEGDGVGLHHIWLKPEFRGRGAGSALMRQLIQLHPVMTLVCLPDLIPFYQRFGFITAGRYTAYKNPGAPESAVIYAGCEMMFRSNRAQIDGSILLWSDDDLRDIIDAMGTPPRA